MQVPCDVMNSRTTHDDVVSFVCVECVSTVVVAARAVVVLLLVLYSSRRD
jgi:hypothetical protein